MTDSDELTEASTTRRRDRLRAIGPLWLGAITAAFAAIGTLSAITSFASLAFIVVFGAVSYLAFDQRGHDAVNPTLPAIGTVGSAGFFGLMFYHLYRSEPGTLVTVVAISIVVIAVEVLYFEREIIEEEIVQIEELVATEAPGGGHSTDAE